MSTPFHVTIGSDKLVKGLRPSRRVPRDSGYLVECQGAVGREGSLGVLDPLVRLATGAITDPFPYPQLFLFTNYILLCSRTSIYEWRTGGLVLKGTVEAGSPWAAISFFEFAYLTNGKVAVIRRASDGVYGVSLSVPIGESLLDVHGQVMVGAPGEGAGEGFGEGFGEGYFGLEEFGIAG